MITATVAAVMEWPYTFSLSAYNFPEYPLAISLYIVFCLAFMGLLWFGFRRLVPRLLPALLTLLFALFFSPVYIDGDPAYFAPAWVGVFLGFVTHDFNLFWLSIAPLMVGIGVCAVVAMALRQLWVRTLDRPAA